MDDSNVKKKILIVDDDNILLAYAEIILNTEYDVLIATSGKKALEHLDDFIPDLILLDILMPEMDGFELYSKIRAIDHLQKIPIVFLTAVSESTKVQQALEIGAADYITKPYIKENLLCRIKNAIQIYEFSKSRKA